MKATCLYCQESYDPEAPELEREERWQPSDFCSLRRATRDWRNFATGKIPLGYFDTDPERLNCKAQIREVQRWIDDRLMLRGSHGLLLHGQLSGTGKTRLGTLAFNAEVLRQWSGRKAEERNIRTGEDSPSGLWFNINGFLTQYRRLMRDAEQKGLWQEELTSAYVLFLDDVDKMKPTEGLTELLFAIFDDRLSNCRETILTTNLNGEALAARWGEEVGPYLVRRLRDYCLCIDFDQAGEVSNVIPLQKEAS